MSKTIPNPLPKQLPAPREPREAPWQMLLILAVMLVGMWFRRSKLLTKYRNALDKLQFALLEHETVEKPELQALLALAAERGRGGARVRTNASPS
jgi:hypothetical protein